MATSSEQDLPAVTEEAPPEYKVIAVKLPFDLQERLLSFPFLHALREKYPTADLHFITPKKYIEVLNLLPFKAYYHEYDDNEISSIFDVHRFTANAKIYNVDLFISLTNSFVDACLGWGLRAKKRLGFSDGWKTLLFNIKTQRPVAHHVCEDFFALYRELTGVTLETNFKVISRDLTPIIADWDSLPYIAINLSPLRNASIEDEFLELISLFENQKIVLFASDDQERVQLLIQPFLAKLSKKNIYVNFVYKSWIDLARMLAFSRGAITFNGPTASLCAYTGSKTLVLYDSEDPQRFGPLYFLADVLVMASHDPSYSNVASTQGVIKDRKTFQMSEVFWKAFEFFKIVIH